WPSPRSQWRPACPTRRCGTPFLHTRPWPRGSENSSRPCRGDEELGLLVGSTYLVMTHWFLVRDFQADSGEARGQRAAWLAAPARYWPTRGSCEPKRLYSISGECYATSTDFSTSCVAGIELPAPFCLPAARARTTGD